jgi:hypothetical protein
MHEVDRSSHARFELAGFTQNLRDCAGATDQRAATTGMAEFRIDQNLLTKTNNGAVLADVSAKAAVCALLVVDNRV